MGIIHAVSQYDLGSVENWDTNTFAHRTVLGLDDFRSGKILPYSS
jgi:hypothetical protein